MKTIFGQNAIREQAADLLTDESRYTEGTPEKIFFPESKEDILFAVKTARGENRKITLIGGKTGLTGGAVPSDGCVAICFSSMNKILRVQTGSPDNCLLECEPGITLKEIELFLATGPQRLPGPMPAGELPAEKQYFYPPDPTEMSAELGGTVATNASGARSYRYGATRAHVEAVSIVLASGETATIARGKCREVNGLMALAADQGSLYKIQVPKIKQGPAKNAAGYYIKPGMDLVDLLIGSEGTLVIFSSITIKVRKGPEFLSGLSFFPSRSAALTFADFLRKEQKVASIEYFDSSALALLAEHRSGMFKALPDFPPAGTAILWEFEEGEGASFENEMERWESVMSACGSSFDKTLAGFDDQGRERLKIFRHAVPEFVNNTIALNKSKYHSIRKVSTDTAVPIERFPAVFAQQTALIEKTGIRYAIFGHLGDGHLHINFMPDNDHEMTSALEAYEQLMTLAIENGGTVSAEHGIGKLKKKYLLKMYGIEAISAMKRIKKVFDPDGLLNPGNLFD